MKEPKAAWYDIRTRGWLGDALILLHLPYTLWHLSYVVIGAALAPELNWGWLLWTLLAFFLAMGIGAHCFDELQGRPLKTKFPDLVLSLVGSASITGAIVIGVVLGAEKTLWVMPCIVFGGFIVCAYNLEWFGGRFHTDRWFGIAWGGFPVITAYLAQAHRLSWQVGLVALACVLYSMAQRALSRQSRFFRRKVSGLQGHYFDLGQQPVVPGYTVRKGRHTLKTEDIIRPADLALKLMTWAVAAAAAGMLLK